MKAFFMLDELNQFHWTMLKSVLLILMLLPITEGALSLWQATEGSSQIMIGFFALSMLSAWLVLCFLSALKTTVWNNDETISKYEQLMFKAYRYIPMLFLSSLVAYLSVQVSISKNIKKRRPRSTFLSQITLNHSMVKG
jgi:hypothetical protein